MNLLSNRNFILLFLSTVISGVGTGITLIGISWIAIQTFESSSVIAILTNASFVATFLFLPKFSTLVDTISRKKIALILFLSGGVIQVSIFLLLVKFGISIPALFISSVASALIRTGDQVNRVALSQELFTKQEYPVLNGYLEIARQTITFLAGGCATLIFRYGGFASMILCDAVTYLVGFALIILITYRRQLSFVDQSYNIGSQKSKNQNNFISQLKESFIYLLQDRNLLIFFLLTLVPYIVVVSQNALYPAHFHTYLNAGSSAFALLAVPYGLGAILAAIVARQSRKFMSSYTLICICCFIYTLFIPLIITVPNVYISFACLFMFAMTHAIIRIERMTILMQKIEEQQMGRVSSFFEMAALIFNIVLVTLVCSVADHSGVGLAWLIFEVVMVATLFGLLKLGSPKSVSISCNDLQNSK
jgi:MFS family permease